MAFAVVVLCALMPTGSWACGQLPAGVEPSGPVLRGEAAPQGGETQPIIYPHCSSSREPAGSAVALAPGKPSKAPAKTVERPAEAN
jgi:hypothetical protein